MTDFFLDFALITFDFGFLHFDVACDSLSRLRIISFLLGHGESFPVRTFK